MKLRHAIILAVLLSGCSTYQYVKTQGDQGTYAQDVYACKRDADQHFQTSTRNVGSIAASIASDMIEHQCMESKGYVRMEVKR